MRYISAFLVWPIALASIPARDMLFGGQIIVWPFIVAAALFAGMSKPSLGLPIAITMFIVWIVESLVPFDLISYITICSIGALISYRFFHPIAALTLATVSLLAFGVFLGYDERIIWIIAECLIVVGLSIGLLLGPSDGTYARSNRNAAIVFGNRRVPVSKRSPKIIKIFHPLDTEEK